LNRANRGFRTIVGDSHVAPLVTRIVRLVKSRPRVAVEDVVDIDRHVRPGLAESQVLADADVECVEAIGIPAPWPAVG
jgi:hypothetical protein